VAADKGYVLPMGGPKGYALALIVSVLAHAVAGGAVDKDLPRFWDNPEQRAHIGYFMGAIDISKFVPMEVFEAAVESIFDEIKATRPAAGFSEVFLPGEIEYNLTQKNLAEGLELSEATLREFKALAEKYGVDYPFGA